MRNACSTQSSYSAGVQQPDHVRAAEDQRLAVPPALVAHRAILRCEEPLDNADAIGVLRERASRRRACASCRARSLRLAGLVPVAGGREVVQAPEQLVLAGADELERLGQRRGRGEELASIEVGLGPPADRAQAARPRRPLLVGNVLCRSASSMGSSSGRRQRPSRGLGAILDCRREHQVAAIDRLQSAARIERDIETLAGPGFTLSSEAIRRYAYTPVYRNTLDYFTRELESIGFEVSEDPVGTLVARNRPAGRAGVRDRLALRLEPQRRQVRRHDGRRHRARGLPAERRARARPAAAARSRSSRRRAPASGRCCSAAGSWPSA